MIAPTPAHPFEIETVRRRLLDGGGFEIVAPESDRRQPHADDQVYVVLGGAGTLDVEGERAELRPGDAVFVPAGAGCEQLSVPVLLDKRRAG